MKNRSFNKQKNFYSITITAMVLLFNSGWINSIVLVNSFHQSVTYMTGNFSYMGITLAKGDNLVLYNLFAITVGFLIGAAINGALLRTSSFSVSDRYSLSFIIQSLFTAAGLALITYAGFDKYTYNDLFFLAIAMGMQNSLTTIYSGAIVRTTHLTGAATDLGIQIGRLLSGKNHDENWKIFFYLLSILSFVLGSAAAAFWLIIVGHVYSLLLLPSIIIPLVFSIFFLKRFHTEK